MLNQSELKLLLRYDPITGIFTRYNKPYTKTTKDGYIRIKVNGRNYMAHRLAFLYMTGAFPDNEVDHINHVRNDNRWINLRQATTTQNKKNKSKPKNNTSGVVGVSWCNTHNKWIARISSKTLGYYQNKENAILVRKSAERKSGYHKNHGS